MSTTAIDPTPAPTPTQAAARIVAALSREEKVRLLSGADFWNTKGLPAHGVEAFMLTDGPHGLRKQAGAADHVGLSDSVPATCFPTAIGLGATWDVALLEEVGAALGREARAEKVGVLLGPGLNLQRHPAGGRTFEYFSEDPLLSGRAAAALVRGIQSEGVGACLKHFAVNNQESHRMTLDTIVDDRTLRELYLRGFEIAVRELAPWTVMSAYNKVNGAHCGESRGLLTGILRDEWGFDGLVVSDWMATSDRPAGIHAGMDLEMPGAGGAWDARVLAALDTGALTEADLDVACRRVVALALRVAAERERRGGPGVVDHDAHHALARRAAAAATVLLRNDGILPLADSGRIALIGAFAEVPRFQGAGSSQVKPTRLDTALDAMRARFRGAGITYVPGYDARTGEATAGDLAAAVRAAREADVAVLLVGLPARDESEGFDRAHLRLPAWHDALVEAVTAANPRTAVVLVNGAPVEMPWADRPAAILEAFLGGQAGGAALVDVLAGDAEPGGRLAQSVPVEAADLPAQANFASHPSQVEYRESFHIGYRFHDTDGIAPRFCFGHGLGYTTFAWSDAAVTGEGTDLRVRVTVTNTGVRAGSDVVQVYLHDPVSTLSRPEQVLAGFAKVHLAPGESRTVEVPLDPRAFAVWDVADDRWKVEGGAFEIRVAASSRDVRARLAVTVESDDAITAAPGPAGPVASDAEFAALLRRPIPVPAPRLPLHEGSPVADLALSPLGRPILAQLRKFAAGQVSAGDDEATTRLIETVVDQMPMRGIVIGAGGRLSFRHLALLLALLNATVRLRRRRLRRFPGLGRWQPRG